jgi:hypothetical protein
MWKSEGGIRREQKFGFGGHHTYLGSMPAIYGRFILGLEVVTIFLLSVIGRNEKRLFQKARYRTPLEA